MPEKCDQWYERAKVQGDELVAHWQTIDSPEARCLLAIAEQAKSALSFNPTITFAVPKMHKITFGPLE